MQGLCICVPSILPTEPSLQAPPVLLGALGLETISLYQAMGYHLLQPFHLDYQQGDNLVTGLIPTPNSLFSEVVNLEGV